MSGVFTTRVSGTTVTGTTAQFTTGTFVSVTGTTTTGTTANFVSGVFTTRVSGTTVTGTTAQFTTGTFVSVTGTTATFSSGLTTSGLTVSGDALVTGDVRASSMNNGPLAGFRNVIINGGMGIDQRNDGAAQTIVNNAAIALCVDRWYAFCAGANVTAQRIQGAQPGLFRMRFTGAASVTNITFGQRIERFNCSQLADSTARLSVDLGNSLLTSVTWTAFYATGGNNSFGSRTVPTRTQIATGTFTVTSTVTRYSAAISIPAAAVTGIEIVFSVGAQTSGTWSIGDVQLEQGPVATPFERRLVNTELFLCERYYQLNRACVGNAQTTTSIAAVNISLYPPMFFEPTVTLLNGTGAVVDPGVATRDLSSLTSSDMTVLGGYFGGTITTSTSSKLHLVLAGRIAYQAELLA